jgi:hypothetical protein
MMQHTTIRALAQDRLAELHRQAQRDTLARTARRPRTAHRPPALLAALNRWARRREAGPTACDTRPAAPAPRA